MFGLLLSFQSTTTVSPVQPPGGGNSTQSSANNTGLIVGLVVGLVGFFALVGGLVAAYFIWKRQVARAAMKKSVSRSAPSGRGPGDSLASRVQPRITRAKRLAPITTSTSQLPTAPVATVAPSTNSSKLPLNNASSRTAAKGIPIRLEPIRYWRDFVFLRKNRNV